MDLKQARTRVIPAALKGIDICSDNAAAVALIPRNSTSERPFTPIRSLTQPEATTDMAPTAGKVEFVRSIAHAIA